MLVQTALIPAAAALGVVGRIERLRPRRYTGPRIAGELALAVSTVALWLRGLGLGRLKSVERKPVVMRYEKKRPGELMHLGIKKLGRIQGVGHRIHGDRRTRVNGIGWEFLHVGVDDATRVAYGELLADEKGDTTAGFLGRAVGWFRSQDVVVERVMSDNGSCYVSHRFRGALKALGARHVRSRPYRPQTSGKAERFIQTAQREWAYARAYRALGNQTPLSRLEDLV